MCEKFTCVYLCGCAVRGSKPDKKLQLTENEVRDLCLRSREIFLSQPMLLDLEAPLKICGEGMRASVPWFIRLPYTSRRHTWAVSRPSETLRTRGFSPGVKLSVFGGLRGSREAVDGDHMSSVSLQDTVPRELLSAQRQP